MLTASFGGDVGNTQKLSRLITPDLVDALFAFILLVIHKKKPEKAHCIHIHTEPGLLNERKIHGTCFCAGTNRAAQFGQAEVVQK